MNVELGKKNRLVQEGQLLIIGQFILKSGTWRKVPRHHITLPLFRYLLLRDNIEVVTQALNKVMNGDTDVDLSVSLGAHMYVSVKSPFKGVSIRQWFRPLRNPDNELLPGYGVFLRTSEWHILADGDDAVDDFLPQIRETERCMYTHHGQLAFIACMECNPDRAGYEYL